MRLREMRERRALIFAGAVGALWSELQLDLADRGRADRGEASHGA